MTELAAAGTSALSTRPASIWLAVHPGLGISMMDHLYNRLDGAYPETWRKKFPDPQSIENWRESWAEAFEEAQLDTEEVRAGLKLVRQRCAWPPSVAEFVQACRPTLDAEAAYHEAVAGLQERQAGRMGVWSHRGIFWAALALRGPLLQQTYTAVKSQWGRVLLEQTGRKDLPEIPEPKVELPAPGRTRTSAAAAAQMLRDLGAGGLLKAVGDQIDHLRWARRIAEQVMAGKFVEPFKIREAEEALRQTLVPRSQG